MNNGSSIGEQEKIDYLEGTYVPFDESKDPNVFWDPDPMDDVVPKQRGIISDMIYYTRGHEVASIFVVWAGLFALSSAVKREAWCKFADKKLFTNIYAIITSPPGIVKKNTAIDLAVNMLKNIDIEIKDKNIKKMKMGKPFTGKATPEALVTQMLPKNRPGRTFTFVDEGGMPMYDSKGRPIQYKVKSEMAVAQRELAQLFGKQTYMEGLINFFLDAYDSPDDLDILTQARGMETLSQVYLTFIGAIAPAALKGSLPEQITGDGFLSRCMVVYQATTARLFSRPRIPEGAPTMKQLRQGLAWIMGNTFGEWDLSKDAEEWYDSWYRRFRKQLEIDGMFQGAKGRFPVILLKIATLFRWQRPDRSDNLIHLEDVVDAEHLLKQTFNVSMPMYKVLFNAEGTDTSLKVETYIEKKEQCSKADLLSKAHILAADAEVAIQQLWAEGKIVCTLDGVLQEEPTLRSKEVYVWIRSKTYNEKYNTESEKKRTKIYSKVFNDEE